MARPNLNDALKRSAKGGQPQPAAVASNVEDDTVAPAAVSAPVVSAPAPTPAPAPAKRARAASRGTREGKVVIAGHYPPEVKSSLRMVQAVRGGDIEDCLAEALNDLFAKYRVPETAPRKQ